MQTPVRFGEVTAVAHSDWGSVAAFAGRLESQGSDVSWTPHFAIARRASSPRTVIAHTFSRETIDEDLPAFIVQELGPLHVVQSDRDYTSALFAIMASTSENPAADQLATWRSYSVNTLTRLRKLLDGRLEEKPADGPRSHVTQFAAIYRRVLQLIVGDSLLDVGTSLGLLPILAAERRPGLEVLGCDNRQEVVTCAVDLAEVTKQKRVRIELRDVLDARFDEVGRFGTVTAIHLLEHLSDDEIRTACGNMLRAGRRLVVAVPYEDTVQHLYGHEQLFDRDKLASWGEWCARRIGGGRYWCEDVSGGLLVVDRPPD